MPSDLNKIVSKIMTPQKGILASDERPNSANKKLEEYGIEGTELNRRRYRELYINADGFENYASCIIIDDETFWQEDTSGKPFIQTLIEKDVLIAVKVDAGITQFSQEEGITLGLDTLKARLREYKDVGASAAKWRATIKIMSKLGLPTDTDIDADCTQLALYALFCQQEGIVPIVEPEILYEGNHTLNETKETMKRVFQTLFTKLTEFNVDVSGIILKTSICTPGKNSNESVSEEQVATATMETFNETLPKNLGGIVFLSGGLPAAEATKYLKSISKLNNIENKWKISFSFLRAVEGPALEIWSGDDTKIKEARKNFIERLKENSEALKG